MFIKDGGYMTDQSITQSHIFHQKVVNVLLIIAGFLSGIGTCLLFGIEMYKLLRY